MLTARIILKPRQRKNTLTHNVLRNLLNEAAARTGPQQYWSFEGFGLNWSTLLTIIIIPNNYIRY